MKRIAFAINVLIEALDEVDAGSEDLENGGDREPDDTGIADKDALATIERAQHSWYEDDDEDRSG